MKRSAFRNFALPCLALALFIAACVSGPTIKFTSPNASGTADYVLAGTVEIANPSSVTTLTYSLNGAAAEPLQLNGKEFSKLITLTPGTNTIIVVATTQSGTVFRESLTVNYDPAAPTTSMTVTVEGLNGDGTATIEVSTPAGDTVDSRELGNGTHTVLIAPGDYNVTAHDANLPHHSYPGEGVAARFEAADPQLAVTVEEEGGTPASASFTYAMTGITDPAGDLPSGAEAEAYDVLFASAFVSGGELTVTLELTSAPTLPTFDEPATGAELNALIQLDLIDGGEEADLDVCSPAETFGSQVDHLLELGYREADGTYELSSLVGGLDLFMTPSIVDNTITLAGPAPMGAADGFVPFFGVVANFGDPSDCFPYSDPPVF